MRSSALFTPLLLLAIVGAALAFVLPPGHFPDTEQLIKHRPVPQKTNTGYLWRDSWTALGIDHVTAETYEKTLEEHLDSFPCFLIFHYASYNGVAQSFINDKLPEYVYGVIRDSPDKIRFAIFQEDGHPDILDKVLQRRAHFANFVLYFWNPEKLKEGIKEIQTERVRPFDNLYNFFADTLNERCGTRIAHIPVRNEL